MIVGPDDARVTVFCVLTLFGLLLVGLALSWLRWTPALPDGVKLPEAGWQWPTRFERLVGFCSARTGWLLVMAFAVQHGSLLLLNSTLE